MTMLGNEQDCICHKPKGKHLKYCDAYRLSEFMKKLACVKIDEGGLRMTKTTKNEYEEKQFNTIQRLRFEIKELGKLNIELQLRIYDLSNTSREIGLFHKEKFKRLRQELLTPKIYDDEVIRGAWLKRKIDSVFAKYGVVLADGQSSSSNEGENPSNPNKCPKCDGRKYLPLFDARGNVDGGEMCYCYTNEDLKESKYMG